MMKDIQIFFFRSDLVGFFSVHGYNKRDNRKKKELDNTI